MRFSKSSIALCLIALMSVFGGAHMAFAQNPALEWKTVVFGQSISLKDNTIEIGADGSITISSLNGKGKVTGAQDGIAFYYLALDPKAVNFVLAADVEVLTFANDNDPAKPKPNNQEAFGLMARDAIGVDGDSTVFASNMVYVGGYRGQLQAVMRENVEESSGMGARMSSISLDSKFPGKGMKYRLNLRKSNTGYHASIVRPGSEEVTFYRPGLMQVQDKNRLYLGFFAARSASIRVSGISLEFSDPAKDPPALPEPPKPIVPELALISPTETSAANYSLVLLPNVDGTLTVSRGGVIVLDAARLAARKEFASTLGLSQGENLLDMSFVPDKGQALASDQPLKTQGKILVKSFAGGSGRLFVSPGGKPDGEGTLEKPLDIFTAVKFLSPGQTISLADGTYSLSAPLIIARGNDGRQDAPKSIAGSDAAKVVLSFANSAPGIIVAGDWWTISGIGVTKSTSTGIRLAGSHNTLERCESSFNANTGIQISGASTDPRSRWPSWNMVKTSLSHDNRDPAESDADGFAAKLAVGPGNVFMDCVSRNNCDDGWDLYTKMEIGAIEPVRIERCLAFGNGFMGDGRLTKGDGNGFKLGGEGIPVAHVIADSLAHSNKTTGFTVNSNPAVRASNVVSRDNGSSNFDFSLYPATLPAFAASRMYSVRTSPGRADIWPASLASDQNYFFNGTLSANVSGKAVPAETYDAMMKTWSP
jgi:hypothetical protein